MRWEVNCALLDLIFGKEKDLVPAGTSEFFPVLSRIISVLSGKIFGSHVGHCFLAVDVSVSRCLI